MIRAIIAAAILALAALPSASAAQEQREPPYWASIAAGEAMMRTGPGRNYPGTWLYRRADLPIKVLEIYPSWRKVEDPDGTSGWMLVNLLSNTRTALVTGDEPRDVHDKPDPGAPIRFRAQPGVVGRISQCGAGWCRLDVKGRAGFIRADQLHGVDPGETLSD